MLLELVADREVAELGRVALPGDCVAARPVAGGGGADVERHADRVAGVEARAAHLGELPSRPQIARALFGIGLKAARSEDHRLAFQLHCFSAMLRTNAMHARIVAEKRQRACAIPDLVCRLLLEKKNAIDQPGAAAHRLDADPAPQLEPAAHLERL